MAAIQYRLEIHGHWFTYTVNFRAQKRLILRVLEGQVSINAPMNTPISFIERFIYQNWPKIKSLQNHYETQAKFDFFASTPWVLIFEEKVIIHLEARPYRARMEKQQIFLPNYWDQGEQVKKLYNFLGIIYQNWFLERTQNWAVKMGVEFKNLSLKVMKLKWGVCYPQEKKIVFNTKLLHFAPSVIDYVLVHELTHLIHPNHSLLFWKKVKQYLPNYQILKNELDQSGI